MNRNFKHSKGSFLIINGRRIVRMGLITSGTNFQEQQTRIYNNNWGWFIFVQEKNYVEQGSRNRVWRKGNRREMSVIQQNGSNWWESQIISRRGAGRINMNGKNMHPGMKHEDWLAYEADWRQSTNRNRAATEIEKRAGLEKPSKEGFWLADALVSKESIGLCRANGSLK